MRKDKQEPTSKHEIEVKLRAGGRAELLRRLRRLGALPLGGRVHEMNVLYDTPGRDLLRSGEALRMRIERPAAHGAAPFALAKPTPAQESRDRSSRDAGRGETVTLTYKGPPRTAGGNALAAAASRGTASAGASATAARYKVRVEDELHVSASEPLDAILRASGFAPSFRYEKYRQAFRLPGLPGLVIDLDETPVGVFVELEGSPVAIDRAAARLGYTSADYITKGYPALYFLSRVPSRGAKGHRQRVRKERTDAMLFPQPRRRRPLPRRATPKRSQ